YARGHDNDAQFRMLIAAGADPNFQNPNGDRPLHFMATVGTGGQILALLEAGADPEARNQQGRTFQDFYFRKPDAVLHEEARAEREAVRSWLRDHGFEVQPAGNW